MNKALFLDRDGILIKDVKYPYKLEDLIVNDDIINHLIWAQEAGFLLIIITNQAGIAKGRFTLDQYNTFQAELIKQLKSRGVNISHTYFCPYHKDGTVSPYNIESNYRKPKPGMILEAIRDYNIDLTKSFMIGDKLSDIIEIESLKSFILESDYTHANKGTYKTIDDIFGEINNELQRNDFQ